MNKVVTSKDELLEAAEQITYEEGMTHLSIRSLAKKLDISVGVVYNYFPSKADLVLAIIENFWKKVFHNDLCTFDEPPCFPIFYESIYQRLSEHIEDFQAVFLGQLHVLRSEDKQKGKALEQQYLQHIQKGFLLVLSQDSHIPESLWTATFTKEAFLQFLFEHMLVDLSHQRKNCQFTKEMLYRLLYAKST